MGVVLKKKKKSHVILFWVTFISLLTSLILEYNPKFPENLSWFHTQSYIVRIFNTWLEWDNTFFFSAFSPIFQFLLPNTQHDRSMILGIFCIFSLLSRQYCKSTPILPPIFLLWLHLKHEGLLPLPVIWFNISVLMILIYCL